VPDYVSAQRPEGQTPDGIVEMREAMADRRAEMREQENALLLSPSTLSTTPAMPWYESVLWPIADLMHFIRNF